MRLLVIGLGNPILGDDGVGWKVAKTLEEQFILPPEVEVDYLAVGGISLMERLIDYDKAIIIDAISTNKQPIGTISCCKLEDLPYRDIGHLGSAHDTTLPEALHLGKQIGVKLPDEISIVAVESLNVFTFSEELSARVAAAIPEVVRLVFKLINDKSAD